MNNNRMWRTIIILVFCQSLIKAVAQNNDALPVCEKIINQFIWIDCNFNETMELDSFQKTIIEQFRGFVEPLTIFRKSQDSLSVSLLYRINTDSANDNSSILYAIRQNSQVLSANCFSILDMMNYETSFNGIIFLRHKVKGYHVWREAFQQTEYNRQEKGLAYYATSYLNGDTTDIMVWFVCNSFAEGNQWFNSYSYDNYVKTSQVTSSKPQWDYYNLGSDKSVANGEFKWVNPENRLHKSPRKNIEHSKENPFNMTFVKGSSFLMGNNNGKYCNEQPAHKVTVRDFYIGKFEVTQEEWESVMGNNPSRFQNCNQCPVEQVSYTDAVEFIRKLNEITNDNYRLPTEAEWEYVAQRGAEYIYSGSNDIDSVAWNTNNSENMTQPVGLLKPNALGLYDMSGNVWEWCSDYYSANYYSESMKENPTGPPQGKSVVLRGGSWNSTQEDCTITYRNFDVMFNRGWRTGFRLAKDVRK